MKVFITGHKGLIGSRLYKYYESQGHDVFGYDLLDEEDNSDVFLVDFDIIHHCASLCVVREVIANPEQMYWNNDITFRVLELARRCKPYKLYMYSSNRVTSNIENPYVSSKKFLENATKGYANCYDIKYIIIRPETIWGYKKNDVRVMPNWIEKALKNDDIIIYGDINKELSPLYVDDFIRQVLALDFVTDMGKTITITGQVMTAYSIAKMICAQLDSDSKIVFRDAELTQPQRSYIRESDEIRLDADLIEDIKRYKKYKINLEVN